MKDASGAIVTIILAVIGVAALAAIIGPKSQTSSVFTSFSNSVRYILCSAMSPVTGGGCATSVTSRVTFPSSLNNFISSLNSGNGLTF